MTCPTPPEQPPDDAPPTLTAPIGRHEGEVPRLGDTITTGVHPLNVPGEQHIEKNVKDQNCSDGGEGEIVLWD